MGKLQVQVSDTLTDKLNELRKFDKGTFVELAIRQALQTDDIVKRFIWKNKPLEIDNTSMNNAAQQNESHSKKSLKIDDDFK